MVSTAILASSLRKGYSVEMDLLEGHCGWGARLECRTPLALTVMSSLWGALSLIYSVLYAQYLFRARRLLHKRLYQRFRLNNISFQLQVRCCHPHCDVRADCYHAWHTVCRREQRICSVCMCCAISGATTLPALSWAAAARD